MMMINLDRIGFLLEYLDKLIELNSQDILVHKEMRRAMFSIEKELGVYQDEVNRDYASKITQIKDDDTCAIKK
jgi:hypothetical protein